MVVERDALEAVVVGDLVIELLVHHFDELWLVLLVEFLESCLGFVPGVLSVLDQGGVLHGREVWFDLELKLSSLACLVEAL